LSSSLHPSTNSAPQSECEPGKLRGASIGRSMELELIPRLLAHARGMAPMLEHVGITHPGITVEDVERFVTASLSHDEERCPAIVAALIEQGAPLDRICLDLLTPAARALGTMWEEDAADFLEVTLGLGRMQRVVRDLGRKVAAETPMSEDAGQAFLCGMPDEQHSLGLAMVAEFFVADGWGVTVGPPLGVDDVLHEVGAHWYDVVGLSAGIVERIPRITEVIRQIRAASLNAELSVLVGGQAFGKDAGLVQRVGADASAPDAAQGPMVARTLVQARRARLARQASPPASNSP
jgi:MerR family transcriptional regulator, light-induced transcriptional regulator